MTFQEKLTEYADLVVQVGLNIQPNQYLQIQTTTDALEFARLVVRQAYQAGAGHVDVQLNDNDMTRAFYDLAPDASFDDVPNWIAAQRDEVIDRKGALLWIDAEDPDLLEGVLPSKISRFQKASSEKLKRYRKAVMNDDITWSIAAVPSKKWAQKVYPEMTEEQSVKALWNKIFEVVRIGSGNAVDLWKAHIHQLNERAAYLNSRNYEALHYTAEGTDLVVGLPKDHIWMSGSSINSSGTPFIANMPTEEVYTLPDRTRVDGTVRNSKPFIYQGNRIDGFTLTFKEGRVIKAVATQGQELLDELLATDENASYLGEVALVPFDSPISNSNTIFFNTLFDENASNHFAFGEAYPTTIQGGKGLSEDELLAKGANVSIVHEDFMVGTSDMSIDGILKDGTREAIFRNGNWA